MPSFYYNSDKPLPRQAAVFILLHSAQALVETKRSEVCPYLQGIPVKYLLNPCALASFLLSIQYPYDVWLSHHQ